MAIGSAFGLAMFLTSLAGAAEPEIVPAGDGSASGDGAPVVAVRAAPGMELSSALAAELRAAVEDALVGRTRVAAPIELTVAVGAVDVRVGTLARRVAVQRWDDVALRTVALHVIDLLQPSPDVVVAAAPAEGVVAAPATESSPPATTWCVRAGAAGLRGAEHDNPWEVAFSAGVYRTYDWLRVGADLGWERAPEHVVAGLKPVSYDAWPVRVAAAAQAGMLEGGIRAGVEVFRVTTTDHSTEEVTPLAGAFIGVRLPATPCFHAVLVGGADVLPRRVQLTIGAATPYTTPRLAPYAGLMIEVGVNP